jgi:hypothetical protein
MFFYIGIIDGIEPYRFFDYYALQHMEPPKWERTTGDNVEDFVSSSPPNQYNQRQE